jgi:MFS family permease
MAEAQPRKSGFAALQFRDFRLIAAGNMVSQLGTWMQYVGLGWVARGLTSSPITIALVFAAQWLPYLLLSPLTGLVADRVDRRKIVLYGNLAMIVPALALGVLIEMNRIGFPSLIGLVIAGGAAQAFTQPAANAFIPALIPSDHLHSAVSLNAGLSSSTRVIGPTIGGIIISHWGTPWSFYFNAISFSAVALACLLVKTRVPRAEPSNVGVLDGLRSGVAYVRANRVTMRLIVMIASVTFLLMHAGLMSIVAKDVLHGGAGTYGLISSGPGFGFVVAALVTTALKKDRHRTAALFYSSFGTGLALVIVGLSKTVPLTVAGMALFGASFMTLNTLATTLLLTTSADEYRGRVMGLFGMVSTGLFTINSFLGGVLASLIGAPLTIWACGAGVLVLVIVFLATGTRALINSVVSAPDGRAQA